MEREEIIKALDILEGLYPQASTQLKYSTPYELLVAVILSAQCTDKRVNEVTKELFKEHNTPEKMLRLSQEQLERHIYTCGLYRSKARHILSASREIVERFDGKVPDSLEGLRTLSGVGRKSANVVYSAAFGGDAIAVDTHVLRVANRIGLAQSPTPLGTEMQLMEAIPRERWSRSHHLLIFHGRNICKAQRPRCEVCPLTDICRYYMETVSGAGEKDILKKAKI
ncbi:MAG: endonuclease III [Clostridiales bacterium]|jgi:endonuclease-3|nr:endonuclease III [Clostridiales bacterium]